MKRKMDIIDYNDDDSAKKKPTDSLLTQDVPSDKIKVESVEYAGENGDDTAETTDLTICDTGEADSCETVPRYVKEEEFETEVMEMEEEDDDDEDDEDDEEAQNTSVPLLSVIIKEEEGNILPKDPLQGIEIAGPAKNKADIKYEDDIEEEEYDSDEDSIDPNELSRFNHFADIDNAVPSNFPNILNGNNSGNSSGTSSHSSYQIDPSTINFGSSLEKSCLEESLANNGFLNGQDHNPNNANDSILLSIVYATINVPFSQVSKFLTAYNLSKSQLSIIRKVRRQVKNRLYAQNCRKRRVAHIKNLANELKQIRVEKQKLCNVQEELSTQMMNLRYRYKQLYAYVMNTLTERYRDCRQSTDEDEPEDSETYNIQKRKLTEENDSLENKKQKIEQKYEELYKHIFKVIAIRHQNNGMSRNGVDNSNIDFKLCNMNIVNELAMLNKYWSKNNITSSDHMDFESSISADGSRTSENKMNDFVDYESSISVDGSRTEENKLNDFIDYDESGAEENMGDDDDDDELRSVTANVQVIYNDDGTPSPTPPAPNEETGNMDQPPEENSRMSEESLIIWSDDEDDEDESSEDEERYALELKSKKNTVKEQYEKLYNHVLQGMEVSETDFLKMFLDFCVQLKMSNTKDSSSVTFNGTGS